MVYTFRNLLGLLGWSKFNNDNFIFREDVILANDCDLFCVCETFLSHNEI